MDVIPVERKRREKRREKEEEEEEKNIISLTKSLITKSRYRKSNWQTENEIDNDCVFKCMGVCQFQIRAC